MRYEVHTRTVRSGNDLPVAEAGPDQIGVESGTIMLAGSASYNPDEDAITFAWEQVSGPVVALASVSSSQTSFAAEEGQTYHFRLTVKDDHGGVGTDRVMVSTVDSRITIKNFTAEPLHIRIGEKKHSALERPERDRGSDLRNRPRLLKRRQRNGLGPGRP